MDHSTVARRIKQALVALEPEGALAALIKDLKTEGFSQTAIYGLFEGELLRARSDPDESSYNAIADVMDRIVGWCPPEQRLFDTPYPT